ncbi:MULTISPECIES: EexN family lipoprotein [Bartonella]|uniref:EexN family lipoprotein n=1 Tax=Bartonella TaxID=773 RepID=UPI0011A856C2|nr:MULTISPECIES: EexN family lipoprotein [Bartonella]
MNKVIIVALLLCTGFVAAGCEKDYSVADFKKDKKLMEEWGKKCEKMGFSSAMTSKNCQNVVQASMELFQEHYKNLAKELRENLKKDETEKQQDHP